MSIRYAWLILGALNGLAAAQTSAPAATRPNVIFILMDDMRWDCLSCTGHPFIKTPNIDRIAHEGAMFKNYFVTLPLCSPSRATLLTGQYAHRNGVVDNVTDHAALSHQLQTFPRLLQPGYETAFIGKWHMGLDPSPRPGFDKWISFKGQGVYLNPTLNIDGKNEKTSGYVTDLLSDYAVDFIKQKHEKPFAFCLWHKAVHQPDTPAERHKNLYSGEDPFPKSPNMHDDLSDKPVLTRKLATTSPAGHPDHGVPEKQIFGQLRCIQAVDDGVGRIFKALEETGQLDNTVIIFSSDNGYFWGEHNLGDKRAAYEESIRDPLLVRYPRLIKPGLIVEKMALNIDIAPTILDLAGVEIPTSMQGKSLLPLFEGKSANWRTSFYGEYFHEKPYPLIPTWQSVRTEDWKYVHYTEIDGMDELYDLKNDPFEMNNLIHNPGAATRLAELQKELTKLHDETK